MHVPIQRLQHRRKSAPANIESTGAPPCGDLSWPAHQVIGLPCAAIPGHQLIIDVACLTLAVKRYGQNDVSCGDKRLSRRHFKLM